MIKKRGVRPNDKVKRGTALAVASSKGYETVVRDFLKYGTKVGTRDNRGQTSVYHAASSGQSGLVKLLIDKNAEITSSDYDGVSPVYAGHHKIVTLLIDDGADMTPNNVGQTAAYDASFNSYIKVLRLLAKCMADLDNPDIEGRTPLLACRFGHIRLAKLLRQRALNTNTVKKAGLTPSSPADFDAYATIVKHLIGDEVDCDGQTNDDWSFTMTHAKR
ncbi:Ankyrin repeat domain-containing protein 50 [Trichoderma lentiforme]|uniref:Ankyrin repeat domain-containing protein 50 n=1 Tax=Trichoderma lentiforme TaxID=1567552 RepID=A0A9P4X2R4_9HYPO|nr:Ankyrin repeat domain-containing protein 50 [Trichoderma lentiforme]